MNFSPFFGRFKILTFLKFYFLINVFEVSSTSFNYKRIQLKNTKYEIIASGNSANNFELLLRVLRGKLTLGPSHMLPDAFFPSRLMFLSPVSLNLNIYGDERLFDSSANPLVLVLICSGYVNQWSYGKLPLTPNGRIVKMEVFNANF